MGYLLHFFSLLIGNNIFLHNYYMQIEFLVVSQFLILDGNSFVTKKNYLYLFVCFNIVEYLIRRFITHQDVFHLNQGITLFMYVFNFILIFNYYYNKLKSINNNEKIQSNPIFWVITIMFLNYSFAFLFDVFGHSDTIFKIAFYSFYSHLNVFYHTSIAVAFFVFIPIKEKYRKLFVFNNIIKS